MSLLERPVGHDRLVELGEIRAAYGIRGWLKLYSWTRPAEQIFEYPCWLVGKNGHWRWIEVENSAQRANSGLVVKLDGIDDRDAALEMSGSTIAIRYNDLPGLEAGQYYWSQLIGLEAVTAEGENLGVVSGMQETGANDVLVVRHAAGVELVPWGESIVQDVDLENRRIIVDWELPDAD